MTLRRLFAGLTVAFGMSVWAWASDREPEPQPTPGYAVQSEGGNQDEAAHRYRTSQSHHWRQVMIGGH